MGYIMASNSRLERLEDNIQDLKMGLAGSYNMTQSVNNKLDQNFQYVNLVLNPIIKKLNNQNKDIDLKAIENNYNNLAQENLSLKKELNDVNNKLENVGIKISSLEPSKSTIITPDKAGSAPKIGVKIDDFVKKIEEAEDKRAEAEDKRAKAEEGRVTAEKGRVTAEEDRRQEEIFRYVAEDERVKVEKERVEKEDERTNAEDIRAKAEEGRVKRINDLEENWEQSENIRKFNELLRNNAEEERKMQKKKGKMQKKKGKMQKKTEYQSIRK